MNLALLPRGVTLLGLFLAASLTACGGGGTYGHSRVYSPTSAEEHAVAAAKEYDPVMAQRAPEQWRGKPVSLFGVVTNRGTGPGGATYLALSMRTLATRNLCDADDEDSCRVTVSDHEHAVVHVLIKLNGDDDLGERSVGMSSLLRIVGTTGDDVDPNDGTPIFRATFYRHWPRGFYVTAKAAAVLRR